MSVATVNHSQLTNEQLQLLKDTICKGATDAEFEMFKEVCKQAGLNPFMRQIYPVKRWDSSLRKEVMTIQTGIDGYRLIAERSGRYAPGRASTYKYDKNGKLVSATAYVKKQTKDGSWHEVEAEAFYEEYVGMKKEGKPTSMWESKPHVMLSKCAEAIALRRAFPAELSGLYTKEEMDQANVGAVDVESSPSDSAEEPSKLHHKINDDQYLDLAYYFDLVPDYKKTILDFLKTNDIYSLRDIPQDMFPKLLVNVKAKVAEKEEKEETILQEEEEK